jgi:hypothetical protein
MDMVASGGSRRCGYAGVEWSDCVPETIVLEPLWNVKPVRGFVLRLPALRRWSLDKKL